MANSENSKIQRRVSARGNENPELIPFRATFEAFNSGYNRQDIDTIFPELSNQQNGKLIAALNKCGKLIEHVRREAWLNYHNEVCPVLFGPGAGLVDVVLVAEKMQRTMDHIDLEIEKQVRSELERLPSEVSRRLTNELDVLARHGAYSTLDLVAAATAYPEAMRERFKEMCREDPSHQEEVGNRKGQHRGS